MAFVLLAPLLVAGVERDGAKNIGGRHYEAAAGNAGVGPLRQRLVCPFGAG